MIRIVGRVVAVGPEVSRFAVGDLAGTGCLVDSCRTCENCQRGLEQYCVNGNTQTYNGLEQDKKTVTYGGYSNTIVVHEDFVLHISDKLDLAATAPLLCAGITTYSPLRHWGLAKGHKLAVVGLGGLGHMGVKFGVAFGAEVTVLSTSPGKEADARKLGAHPRLKKWIGNVEQRSDKPRRDQRLRLHARSRRTDRDREAQRRTQKAHDELEME